MDKEIHIIYYGKDGDKAKELAVAIRADRKTAQVRHAEIFDGAAEDCAAVTILPCVSGHDAGRIRAAYGDKVLGEAPKVITLPKLGNEPVEVVTLPKLGGDEQVVQPLAAPVTLPPPPVTPRKVK